MPPRCGMHTTLTPCCLHEVTFFSLKKPRSDPYNLGTPPKVCLWRSSETTTCCSSTGFPSSISYCAVAEFDRRLHLAALDEVRVGLKNRIELLDSWNLLAVEHTAARLINHAGSQSTKVLD